MHTIVTFGIIMTNMPSLPSTLPTDDGPLVSVVVPTYNDAEYIGTALESIAAQTYSMVEAVVIDSSGINWLESLAAETDWIEYAYQEPAGLSAARNYGIELASGEYVGFLDADDEWLPEKLAQQLSAFKAGADIVYSDALIVEEGKERRLSSLPIENPEAHYIDFLYEGGVPILSVVVRRSCLVTHRFDETLPAVEDRHLLARLFYEYEPARIGEPLVKYNRREDSMSSDANAMYSAELDAIESLLDRYEELESHIEELRMNARYKYGKRLLRTGHKSAARRELFDLIPDGYSDAQVLALLLVALMPIRGRQGLWWLERIQERFI